MEKLGEIIRSVSISKRAFMFTQSLLIQTGRTPSKKWSGQNLTSRTAGSGPVFSRLWTTMVTDCSTKVLDYY